MNSKGCFAVIKISLGASYIGLFWMLLPDIKLRFTYSPSLLVRLSYWCCTSDTPSPLTLLLWLLGLCEGCRLCPIESSFCFLYFSWYLLSISCTPISSLSFLCDDCGDFNCTVEGILGVSIVATAVVCAPLSYITEPSSMRAFRI